MDGPKLGPRLDSQLLGPILKTMESNNEPD